MFSKITKILVLMIPLVIGFVISVFPVTVSCQPPEVEGWTLKVDRGPIAGNPDLVEYVWNTSRPPSGLYDKIAVRRVVRADGEAGEGVVFILPGTWSSGEQLVHVRKDGIQYGIPDANKSILLYLAKRGFDVYTLDYRTHFVPHTVTNHTFMLNWGWDAWMGDMKAAVDLIKTVSGVSKIYIAGESFGGGAAMNYASMYWEEDLRGIILLDAFWCKSAGKWELETNSYNLTAAMEEIIASGEYSWPSAGGPNNPIWADALASPGNTLLRSYLMNQLFLARSANPYSYPWSQPDPMFAILASFDPYWPARLGNESVAYLDWIDCPYLSYDFDDHYIEIDVPVIAFLSERFGYYYWGDLVNGIANPDFTGILLEGYGHLDVYAGTHTREDVNEPTYQWLMGVRRLTVASSPITGVTFTINGVPQTTPYTEWLPEGSYALEMPETHTVGEAKYYWNQWSDEATSRSRTVTTDTEVTLTGDFAGPYYELTVASSPITGVTFTINGVPQTTPYTEWLPEGSHTLRMPETHNGYFWSHWLEDGDTNRIKTITLPGTTWTAVYEPSVGGKATPINIPMNKPELQTPWIWLLTILLAVAVVTVGYVKKRKRYRDYLFNKQSKNRSKRTQRVKQPRPLPPS